MLAKSETSETHHARQPASFPRYFVACFVRSYLEESLVASKMIKLFSVKARRASWTSCALPSCQKDIANRRHVHVGLTECYRGRR